MNQAIKAHDARSEAEAQKFLTFTLKGEGYGISILLIKEIIEFADLTPVPMMPEFVMGAINLRGHVVPVIDLSKRLGAGTTELGERSCVVIVELTLGEHSVEVGLVVDAVRAVLDIAPADIEPAPSFGGQIRTEFIRGIGKSAEGTFTVLLDVPKLLSLDDLARLEQASGRDADAVQATGAT